MILPFGVRADYGYRSLSEVIEEADYCVVGTIVKLDMNYYYVKVESVVFGELAADTIPVIRFEDWNCAKRYGAYEVGQKEIVFTKRSNYELEEFDYNMIGGGSENELVIIGDSVARYKFGYNHNHYSELPLTDLINAIRDYKVLAEAATQMREKGVTTAIDFTEFSKKSEAHAYLGKYNSLKRETEQAIPDTALVVNMENDYLYEGYDNKLKVLVQGEQFENLIMEVKDATVQKKADHFIVNPVGGWSRRWIYLKKVNSSGDTVTVYGTVFNVYPVPEPTIYTSEDNYSDTVNIRGYSRPGRLQLKYRLGDYRDNDYLEYEVLKFDVDIISNGQIKTLRCKNEWGTHEYAAALENLKKGDTVRYYNVYVKYPDGQVKVVPEKKVYVIDRKE